MSRMAPIEAKGSLLRAVCLVLALVTLLLYLPVRHHDFIRMDDMDYITGNPKVQAGLTWDSVKWAFTTWHSSNWHPLTWLSHMLDCQLFGVEAGPHHLVNAMLHTLNAVLLCVVWYRLTGLLWPAAIVAALFAWHPLHVESVAWASERKDVLSTLFFLLTLIAYERYARATATPARPTILSLFHNRHGWRVVILFALGLMAKPMLVTLPFVLLLLDAWPLQRLASPKELVPRLREKLPLFVLTAASCVITFMAQRAEAVVSLQTLPLGVRVENVLLTYARYLGKTIWPVDLAVFYPLEAQLNPGHVMLAGGLLTAITICVLLLIKSRPCLALGWFWFLGTLVPVIGLVQVGSQGMADRYTYLPLIGIFVAAVYSIQHFASAVRLRRVFVGGGCGLMLAACLYATYQQLKYWQDSETLFRRTVAVTTNNATAHAVLGFALAAKGSKTEARQEFQTALAIKPALHDVHNDLAVLYQSLGNAAEALQHYQEAIRLSPNNPIYRANRGQLLAHLGRFDEALACYAEAIQLNPRDPHYHFFMGKAYRSQGRSDLAIQSFRAGLQIAPDDIENSMALCRTLAADPDPKFRNGAEAIVLGERVNAALGGQFPVVLDVLAMAYAEAGRFELARTTLTKALNLAATDRTNSLHSDLRERLKLYEAGTPYRENWTNLPPLLLTE